MWVHSLASFRRLVAPIGFVPGLGLAPVASSAAWVVVLS